ncbi:hypothetical protein ABPG72_006606 [Tetrahymena utriculariae]
MIKRQETQMKNIDVRSDTVTHPTKRMYEAMFNAQIGDDVYYEDDTVNKLEKMAAELVGMEAALFVPTGTMGNQILVMAHCQRGQEIIIGIDHHVAEDEVAGCAVLAGVQTRTLPTKDGYMDLQDIENSIRKDIYDWIPETGLICLENSMQGRALSLEYMAKVRELGNKYKIPVHLDGARMFNACTALKCSPREMSQYVDSLNFCLSKGLCAPIGSMICGSKKLIQKARRLRKLLGGGMRQVGIIAAAGIIAIQEMIPQLEDDHRIARILAEELSLIPEVDVKFEALSTNMVFWQFRDQKARNLVNFQQYLARKNIKISLPWEPKYWFRFVVHHYIREQQVQLIVDAIKSYVAQSEDRIQASL